MINIHNIPLVAEESEEYKNFFSTDGFACQHYVKPIFDELPDFSGMEEEDKKTYKLRDLKEGLYLVGLEIISDSWLSRGFCASLFYSFGLVIDEAYPVEMKGDNYKTERIMYFVKFSHIIDAASENDSGDNIYYTVKTK